MSSQTHDDATPITSREQLVGYILAGCKPRQRWVVGTEHEKLGWLPDVGRRPSFEGPRGIGDLFLALMERGWQGHAEAEGGPIVALAKGLATITLEPGGQLELSGAPLPTLVETKAELEAHFDEVRELSASFGQTWSGLGYMPVGTPATSPWMPKARYRVMKPYMARQGRLAHHMMAMTCTVQANYDFADEADAMAKLRVSASMQPLVFALFANSTVVDGKVSPYRCFRAAIWAETDKHRCELPVSLLSPGATLGDYVEWAVDVPMFFIYRDGGYVDTSGLPFRRFIEAGAGPHHATIGDFGLHLSTLFPDVRIKQHLEVRAADMGAPAYVLALPALHKGILYDEHAMADAAGLLACIDPDDIAHLNLRIATDGLEARTGPGDAPAVAEVARELVTIARRGLAAIEPEATGFLDVLLADLDSGMTQADRTRRDWAGDPARLLADSRVC